MASLFRCKIGVVLEFYTLFLYTTVQKVYIRCKRQGCWASRLGLALEVNFQRPWPLPRISRPQVERGRGKGLWRLSNRKWNGDMEWNISWRKLVFMDRKLLPASARCRRYSRYVAFVAIWWNICFMQTFWKQDFCSLRHVYNTSWSW